VFDQQQQHSGNLGTEGIGSTRAACCHGAPLSYFWLLVKSGEPHPLHTNVPFRFSLFSGLCAARVNVSGGTLLQLQCCCKNYKREILDAKSTRHYGRAARRAAIPGEGQFRAGLAQHAV
jgi:hypothetical protein